MTTWGDQVPPRDLEQDAERYRLLAEHASDVIVLGAPDRDETVWISPSVHRVLGWDPSDWLGCSPIEFIHPDDVVRLVADLERPSGNDISRDEYRVRDVDGGYHAMLVLSSTLRDGDGIVVGRVAALRDVTEAVAYREQLERSEAQFRMLAENASDVVYQLDLDGIIRWISPSVEGVLGWRSDDLLGRPATELIAPEDLGRVNAPRARVYDGDVIESEECRFRTATGALRWMAVRAKPIVGADGRVTASIVSLRDCHREVVARRAARVLSAGNATLAGAAHEATLVQEICQIAVDEGGYLFAWYGRPVGDRERTVAKVAASREHHTYLDAIEVAWGEGPLGQGPGGTALRTGRTVAVSDFATGDEYAPWRAAATEHGFRSAISLPIPIDDHIDGALMVYAGEVDAFDPTAIALLEDLARQLGSGISRLRDAERLSQSRAIQTLLNTAIDQAAEAVIVTDLTGTILYANPAAVRSSGYGLDELIGHDGRIFGSGLHSPASYDEIRAALAVGEAWHGVLVNRRKNGEPYEEDSTIAPVRDAEGEIVASVVVKHDLTFERKLEADLDREHGDREAVLDLMRGIRPGATLAESATAFCDAVRHFEQIDGAMVMLMEPDGTIVPIAVSGTALPGLGLGAPMPVGDGEGLVAVTDAGPWWLDLGNPDTRILVGDDLVDQMLELGITATGYAPMRWRGRLGGVLAVATHSADGAQWMPTRTGVLEELGTLGGTLFGDQAEEHQRDERRRAEINATIREVRFHPVFQPVIDLDTGAVVGYEALTRFDIGLRPDLQFAEAEAVGLGPELEVACAAVAVEQAAALPDGRWLSINFSPEAILLGHAATVVNSTTRPTVVEITEHVEIASYDAVLDALRACTNCRVSVDDAGAGWASLRHILELKPEMVKLDIGLVRDIDRDPAKQALAAGLCYFAQQSGTTLIAEGVETEAEAGRLRALGVHLAQGYLFGHPASIAGPMVGDQRANRTL